MSANERVPLDLPFHFNIAAHFVDCPAREHPQRIAVLGEPQRFCYGELGELTNRVGNALLALGCSRGDRVLIVLPDSVEFIATFFGAAKIGAVAVPVNPFTRASEYAHYLEDSGARLAIVHATAWAEFAPAAEGRRLSGMVRVGTPAGPALPGCHHWPDWVAASSAELEPHGTRASDVAFFLYTSGSGGVPKGAVHEHKDMLVTANCYAHGVLGITADDVTFSVSKLFFAYGLGNGMYFPLSVGARTVLNAQRPRVDRVVEMVVRHRPTLFFAVPTFFAGLLREVEAGRPADFSSVRLAVSAGEALPAEIFKQFHSRFGIEILDGIGSTEMLHMFLSSRAGAARPGACGIEVPHTEARILDEAGTAVPTGEIGNLWVKGPSAFREYWEKPELTAGTCRNGWVLTGDKFYRDSEGYYHHCGRTDDMLKVSGMWVSPGEVENALLAHPAVAEAAVVGKPDDRGLVAAQAFVVLRAGVAGDEERAHEIREFLKSLLPSYKCPRVISFLPELPRTATGKIQRFKLR